MANNKEPDVTPARVTRRNLLIGAAAVALLTAGGAGYQSMTIVGIRGVDMGGDRYSPASTIAHWKRRCNVHSVGILP